jgi:hypothetical protein
MSLIDRLEEDFLEEFSEVNLDGVASYIKENYDALIFLCKFKEEVKKEIEEILGKKIIKKVQENYYPKLLRGDNKEFLPHPEYLAYALQENIFSFDELRKINLGNDSWKKDFIRKYSKENILKNFREKLLLSLE